MLRSLYTGISGLRAMQTLMDVTGNNIANVNTTGYKTTNTVFEDTLSQTLRTATSSTGANGGTNPAQVGLGVRVASITNNFTEGAAQSTGVNSNMMLNGDGFFVVRSNGINEYTRNGAFTPDAKGELVNGEGAQLMGWQADPATGTVSTAAATTTITIPTGLLSNPAATKTVTVNGNLNTAADSTKNDSVVPMNFPIYDKQGASSSLGLTFTPKAPSAGSTLVTQWDVAGTYGNPAQTFKGMLGIAADKTVSWNNAAGSIPTTAVLDAGGKVTGFKIGDGTATGLKGLDTALFAPTVDLSTLTATPQSGDTSSAKIDAQDGHAAASLSSWKIGEDGTVTGTFSDGTSQTLAQIAVATFDNPEGLSKEGGSMYSSTVNSGTASIGAAGNGDRGTITSGALEMSNVDLSQEFTNLIIAQRGFQANSKVITTSDDILQTLVNLKQ